MKSAFTIVEFLVSIAIVAIIIALTLCGIQKVRMASLNLSCKNNLRQLAIANQHFLSNRHTFPIGTGADDKIEKYPFLNWHARLLPFLEMNDLWLSIDSAFAIDRNFLNNPPHTAQEKSLPYFFCPADARTETTLVFTDKRTHSLTSYLGVNGTRASKKDGILFQGSRIRSSDVVDGISNTLLIGERPPAGMHFQFGWWYAGWGSDRNGEADGHLGARTTFVGTDSPGCFGGPFEFKKRSANDPCNPFQFWSLHDGGANFVFADGSIKFLSYSANDILFALSTRAGGEIVSIPQ